jgi:hypothetical protein
MKEPVGQKRKRKIKNRMGYGKNKFKNVRTTSIGFFFFLRTGTGDYKK